VADAAVGIEVAIAARMWMIDLVESIALVMPHLVLPNLMNVHLTELQSKLSKRLNN
jgi:hypothetical protein